MLRRQFTAAVWAAGPVLLAATAGWWPARASALSQADAAAGVRAALERGATAAVAGLGRSDGFLANPRVRIPLPGPLQDVRKLLQRAGQGEKIVALETAMNRAAEAAVPEARGLLVAAVKSLSVDDALAIVRGGDTAVTDFFSVKTRAPLAERFLPIVGRATEKVDLAARYNAVAGRAAKLGLLKGDAVNLEQHVTAKALDGLFLMIGDEEKKIRADPLKTGSAILRQVFGR